MVQEAREHEVQARKDRELSDCMALGRDVGEYTYMYMCILYMTSFFQGLRFWNTCAHSLKLWEGVGM